MILALRRAASGSLLLGLAWLWASAPLSCATSTEPDVPPPHDAGHEATKETSTSQLNCGAIGQKCCAPPTQCDIGSFCAPDGKCKTQHPSDIGQPCSSPSSCQSGICGYTQGIMDGSVPVPDGNGTPPPNATGCTVGCYNTSDCLDGWTCQQLTVGEGVCSCSWSPEICDGLDNNCDGIIDNQPEVDNYCTQMDDGIPQKCVKGNCVCVTTCNEECVDVQTDDNNCGKCNHACKAMVEKCVKGECGCAYTVCDGQCVNTGGSDNKNCGGCGIPCAYQCAEGSCGPTTLATGFDELGSIAVDSTGTNVYFVVETTADVFQIQYCPVTGCTTPTVLAGPADSFGEVDGISQLALTGTRAYFYDGEEGIDVCSLPPTGCGGTATVYSSLSGFDISIAASATDVAWTNEESDLVDSCAVGATCATPTAIDSSAEDAVAVAVSGSTIYWADFDFSSDQFGVQSAPLSGAGPTTTVCTSTSFLEVASLIVVGGNVYFTATEFDQGVYVCPISTPGVAAATFYADTASPTGLATDGTNLYWTEDVAAGSILKCALGTTCASPTTLASGVGNPYGLAVSPSTNQIFFTTNGATPSVEVFHN